MSEVVTGAYDKVHNILFQFRSLNINIRDARNQILAIPELAIVDREASPPENPWMRDNSIIYGDAQRDMLKTGWVKEVKE